MQLTNPDGGGPDGATTTARAGGSGGTPTTVPIRAGNPVTTVSVWAGDVVGGIQFTSMDGSRIPVLGTTNGSHTTVDFYDHTARAGRVLSSIHVNGTSTYYGTADAVVFGFKYEPPTPSREDDRRASATGRPVPEPARRRRR